MGSAAAAWELPAGRMSLRLLPNVGGGGTTSSGPSLIASSLVFGRRGGCKQLAATMCQRWLLVAELSNQPLFLARPAGTPSSAHRGRTRPLTPPGEPPSARAAPGGTASTAPRSLGAPFENGSSQRRRGARWWLCRRTFRLMTCTDRNQPRNGVQRRLLSVGSSLTGPPRTIGPGRAGQRPYGRWLVKKEWRSAV